MSATALIVSVDAVFAKTVEEILRRWDMAVVYPPAQGLAHFSSPRQDAEIVLLDLRQQSDESLALLPIIKKGMPDAEVILINRPDNIQISIAGMQGGAADELIAPFDLSALKTAISQALRRREKRRGRKSLFKRFGEAMAAATFAQAGEFDTAISLLEGEEEENQQTPDGKKS